MSLLVSLLATNWPGSLTEGHSTPSSLRAATPSGPHEIPSPPLPDLRDATAACVASAWIGLSKPVPRVVTSFSDPVFRALCFPLWPHRAPCSPEGHGHNPGLLRCEFPLDMSSRGEPVKLGLQNTCMLETSTSTRDAGGRGNDTPTPRTRQAR